MTIFVLTSQDFENFDLGTFQKYLSDSKVTSYLFKSQNPHFEAKNGICLSVSDRKLACRAKYFFVGNSILALGKYLKLVSIDGNKKNVFQSF